MEFMTTNDAVKKWGISERRIRQLLQDGRIEGAVKVGNNWNIPINANKPADKRSVKLDNIEFKFDLPDNYFDKVDELINHLIYHLFEDIFHYPLLLSYPYHTNSFLLTIFFVIAENLLYDNSYFYLSEFFLFILLFYFLL